MLSKLVTVGSGHGRADSGVWVTVYHALSLRFGDVERVMVLDRMAHSVDLRTSWKSLAAEVSESASAQCCPVVIVETD